MARAKNADAKTLDLIKEVNRQKAEISKAEKPNWKTNCSFTYTEGRMSDAVNLHVESNAKNLISYAAFLIEKEESYNKTAKYLGVESAPAFTWNGFPVSDWLEDIGNRINKLMIADKRRRLEYLEARLNAIISPELRAAMELEAIASELVK